MAEAHQQTPGHTDTLLPVPVSQYSESLQPPPKKEESLLVEQQMRSIMPYPQTPADLMHALQVKEGRLPSSADQGDITESVQQREGEVPLSMSQADLMHALHEREGRTIPSHSQIDLMHAFQEIESRVPPHMLQEKLMNPVQDTNGRMTPSQKRKEVKQSLQSQSGMTRATEKDEKEIESYQQKLTESLQEKGELVQDKNSDFPDPHHHEDQLTYQQQQQKKELSPLSVQKEKRNLRDSLQNQDMMHSTQYITVGQELLLPTQVKQEYKHSAESSEGVSEPAPFYTEKLLCAPQHKEELLHKASIFYQKETYVDVVICCDDGVVKAHKLVLAVASPFLKHLCEESPNEQVTIILPETKCDIVQVLIHFMYTGTVKASQEQLDSLVELIYLFRINASIESESSSGEVSEIMSMQIDPEVVMTTGVDSNS